MKVKEAYSDVFKEDKKEFEEKFLKQKGDLVLIEYKSTRPRIPYSKYLIHDLKLNHSYIRIFIPDPMIEKGLYKDIFLKYQSGARQFLLDFFDVLTGEKEDIEPMYTFSQKKEFEYKEYNNWCGSVVITPLKDDFIFGIVEFGIGKSLDITKKFLGYFEGKKVNFKEDIGLCERFKNEVRS